MLFSVVLSILIILGFVLYHGWILAIEKAQEIIKNVEPYGVLVY
jgi:hypothetical protein